MNDHETAFNQWKEDTRREALEKEVNRLHDVTEQQQNKVKKLRRTLVLVILAAVISLAALFFFTFDVQKTSDSQFLASVSKEDTAQVTQSKKTEVEPLKDDSSQTQSLQVMTPTSDTVEFFIPDDGIFFSIQIGAYLGIDLDQFRSNMVSLYQDNSAGINQFTLGVFPTYEEATHFKEAVKRLGLEGAHIVAFQNGHRIKVEDALNLRTDSVPGQLTGR